MKVMARKRSPIIIFELIAISANILAALTALLMFFGVVSSAIAIPVFFIFFAVSTLLETVGDLLFDLNEKINFESENACANYNGLRIDKCRLKFNFDKNLKLQIRGLFNIAFALLVIALALSVIGAIPVSAIACLLSVVIFAFVKLLVGEVYKDVILAGVFKKQPDQQNTIQQVQLIQ